MQVYAVVLRDDSQGVRNLIQKDFEKDMFKISENYFLVRTENTDAKSLSRSLGIPAELDEKGPRQSGVVFRLSPHYWGFWDKTIWEWLGDAFEAKA